MPQATPLQLELALADLPPEPSQILHSKARVFSLCQWCYCWDNCIYSQRCLRQAITDKQFCEWQWKKWEGPQWRPSDSA